MTTQQWLIIGQGDIGLPVTNRLVQDSLQDNVAVTGLARSERSQYALDDKANFIQADALTLTAEQLQN